jgi:hypothetical protein
VSGEQDTTLTLFRQRHNLVVRREVESHQAALVGVLALVDETGDILLLNGLV